MSKLWMVCCYASPENVPISFLILSRVQPKSKELLATIIWRMGLFKSGSIKKHKSTSYKMITDYAASWGKPTKESIFQNMQEDNDNQKIQKIRQNPLDRVLPNTNHSFYPWKILRKRKIQKQIHAITVTIQYNKHKGIIRGKEQLSRTPNYKKLE